MSVNPRIATVELGIRKVASYKIYPLSMADQFRLTDKIAKAAQVFDAAGAGETEAVKVGIDFVKDNLESILEMVTEEKNRPTMEELDNVQFSELVDLIFETNYAGTIKNFKLLAVKAKGLFQSTKQQPTLLEEAVTD